MSDEQQYPIKDPAHIACQLPGCHPAELAVGSPPQCGHSATAPGGRLPPIPSYNLADAESTRNNLNVAVSSAVSLTPQHHQNPNTPLQSLPPHSGLNIPVRHQGHEACCRLHAAFNNHRLEICCK